jgi:hypothetical protein
VDDDREPGWDEARRDDAGAGGGTPHDPVAPYAAHRLSLVRLAVLLVDDLGVEDVVLDAFAGFAARHQCYDLVNGGTIPAC